MDADLLKLVIFPVAFIALMAIIKIGGLFFRKSEPRDWTEGEGNSLVTMRLASFDDAGGPPLRRSVRHAARRHHLPTQVSP
ncbi:hypothetical protein [Burkholderia sp. BCC1970]|uniref:hypothetical protein n=1 Tax=Burkholderia sp. BCC1970 TaxID=2817437 RepID=UPI002ABE2CBF|nr:hypothetical protein [Burkholderia sp. BCC1970]